MSVKLELVIDSLCGTWMHEDIRNRSNSRWWWRVRGSLVRREVGWHASTSAGDGTGGFSASVTSCGCCPECAAWVTRLDAGLEVICSLLANRLHCLWAHLVEVVRRVIFEQTPNLYHLFVFGLAHLKISHYFFTKVSTYLSSLTNLPSWSPMRAC